MPNPTETAAAGTAAKEPILLWSTNTRLKFHIQQTFYGGVHFVWCSPTFSAATLGRYAIGSSQPPSSDPYSIYQQLHEACRRSDQMDAKIANQKKTLTALAVKNCDDGVLSEPDRDEIVATVEKSSFEDWRPLIYAIPFQLVKGRVELVPRENRASREPEYIIKDLRDGEFHIIEPFA
jgi:hypothetical protein